MIAIIIAIAGFFLSAIVTVVSAVWIVGKMNARTDVHEEKFKHIADHTELQIKEAIEPVMKEVGRIDKNQGKMTLQMEKIAEFLV